MNTGKLTLTFLLVSLMFISLISLNQVYADTEEEETTESSATVSEYLAIDMSTNLTSGILFGNVDPATTNNNATGNNMSGDSQYYITISGDSNINVDLCIKANASMSSGLSSIELGNYTWDNSTVASNPALPGTAIETDYALSGEGITPGSNNYYRFWLDIPSTQSAGTYANTVSFKAVKTGEACQGG